MPILFAIGRVAFVLIFILSGGLHLLALDTTAADILKNVMIPTAKYVPIPSTVSDVAAQIATAAGMPTEKILAIVVVVIEIGCGLLIAFNIGTRFASAVLLLFTIAATFYFHDFWSQPDGPEKINNMNHAMKNLSLIGALLVFFVLGSWRPAAAHADAEEMRY